MSYALTGGPAWIARLQGMEDLAAREDALMGLLMPGATLVRDAAAANAPFRSGRLARSMVIQQAEGTEYRAMLDIGPTEWYARYDEFGTKPHEQGKIAPHIHPGEPAHPFLRPAMDENVDEIVRLTGEGLRAELEVA